MTTYCTECGEPCEVDPGYVWPPSERRRLEPRPTNPPSSMCCGADVTDEKPEPEEQE